MATGGKFQSEEDLYSFELYECNVCLESIINKEPRLLPCGHSFCTPCLNQVAQGNTVICPKCRHVTRLPNGSVTDIPKNTDIGKMREREEELAQRGEKCQMCKKKNSTAEYICTECPLKLICKGCADRHKVVPVLQSHSIVPIETERTNKKDHEKCEKHDQLLEYFCSLCVNVLCAVCLFEPEHEGHSDKILDCKTGIKKFTDSVYQTFNSFKTKNKNLDLCIDIIKEEYNTIIGAREALTKKCQSVALVLDKLRNQLNVVTELEMKSKNRLQAAKEHQQKVQSHITYIEDIYKVKDHLKDFLYHSGEWCRKSEQLIEVTSGIYNQKLNNSKFLSCNIKIPHVPNLEFNEVRVREKVQSSLQGKQLILNIQPGTHVKFQDPAEVVSVGDGSVILVDKALNYLQRVDQQGKVIQFYRTQFSGIKSACVYGKFLYWSNGVNCIAKMQLDGTGVTSFYEPQLVQQVDFISAIDVNTILITDSSNNRIYEYDMKLRLTTERTKRQNCIIYSGKVSYCPYHKAYIVAGFDHSDTQLRYVVHIYSNTWAVLREVEIDDSCSVFDRNQICMTSTSNILIQNKLGTLSVYKLDGTCVHKTELSDKYKNNGPLDIAVYDSTVWVLECKPICLSVYKFSPPL